MSRRHRLTKEEWTALIGLVILAAMLLVILFTEEGVRRYIWAGVLFVSIALFAWMLWRKKNQKKPSSDQL